MLNALTESSNRFKNLRKFNLIMGFFHLAQAIAMFVISSRNEEYEPQKLINAYIKLVQNGENFSISYITEEIGWAIHVGYAVVLFLIISASAHFLLSTPGIYEWYVENLKKGVNYARWFEYMLSSSVMIVIIGVLSGIWNAQTLVLLFTLNVMMIAFGLVMEKMNIDSKDNVDWTAFIYGSIAGIVPWVVIVWYFLLAITKFEGENPVPDFVYGILVSLFVFFNVFAVNMFLQYKKVGPWKNYLFGEAMYIILSLLAKSALAWQVWSGTLR